MKLDPRLFAAVERLPHSPLFVTISGAHLYGFASPDSDYDLRGAHLLPLREVVGLFPARETLEISEVRDGIEWDIVSHDARKFFTLLAKGSGYALEQVVSPLVVATSPAHEELIQIGKGSVSLKFAAHYKGFALNQWRLFQKETPPRVKPLLYIYRVLLTGIHLLRSGEVEPHLPTLNLDFKSPIVDELIAAKTAEHEQLTLPNADRPFFESEYQRLYALLETTEANSKLPAEVDVSGPLDDLLIRLRMEVKHEKT